MVRRDRCMGALNICAVVVAVSAWVGCNNTSDTEGRHPLGAGAVPGAVGDAMLPPGLNAAAAARLDSGNVAFRMKQYPQALTYYRAAATDVPNHAAPWYGILMVAQATGNVALADSATRAVASRNGGGELLDTSLASAHTGAPPGK